MYRRAAPVRNQKKGTSKNRRALQQNVWQLLVGLSLYSKGPRWKPRQCLFSGRCGVPTGIFINSLSTGLGEHPVDLATLAD
jgi:hypothetical protein